MLTKLRFPFKFSKGIKKSFLTLCLCQTFKEGLVPQCHKSHDYLYLRVLSSKVRWSAHTAALSHMQEIFCKCQPWHNERALTRGKTSERAIRKVPPHQTWSPLECLIQILVRLKRWVDSPCSYSHQMILPSSFGSSVSNEVFLAWTEICLP